VSLRRLRARPWFLAAALAGFACLPEPKYPGNEVMGTFDFTATALSDDCAGLSDIPDGGFTFSGTFSRQTDNSQAWFTLGGISREASFDGQVVRSERTAPRRFPECLCGDKVNMVETLVVALSSKSQDALLGGGCPDAALDGGLPAPNGDLGVFAPGTTPQGFDAVRACGELTDVIAPDPAAAPACQCASCTLRYTVRGDRK
jgi:hypothetical protein